MYYFFFLGKIPNVKAIPSAVKIPAKKSKESFSNLKTNIIAKAITKAITPIILNLFIRKNINHLILKLP